MKVSEARPALPAAPSLVRVATGGETLLARWSGGKLHALDAGLDALLHGTLADARERVARATRELDPDACELLAPAQSQEVWAAGVTYRRSRDARIEESADADIYSRVYAADRPELFFKAAGWRVVPHGGAVGVRPDSSWDVPEPELAVLTNRAGEVVAWSCGNDMSSRSIEGENPLYLPQAKVYDRSCSIGPAAVLAWELDPRSVRIAMRITRGGRAAFDEAGSTGDMVRDPAELCRVLGSAYPLPDGAWLLTGTSLVPPLPYTATAGDVVEISIDGLGTLRNAITPVAHTGAAARPRL